MNICTCRVPPPHVFSFDNQLFPLPLDLRSYLFENCSWKVFSPLHINVSLIDHKSLRQPAYYATPDYHCCNCSKFNYSKLVTWWHLLSGKFKLKKACLLLFSISFLGSRKLKISEILMPLNTKLNVLKRRQGCVC